MRYLVLALLGALLLWVVYILMANRRKQPRDNRSGDSGSSSGDSGSYNSSHCDSSDSGCGGDDGGGD